MEGKKKLFEKVLRIVHGFHVCHYSTYKLVEINGWPVWMVLGSWDGHAFH
jgi:hypothetical protein